MEVLIIKCKTLRGSIYN